jgi:hypothetical protein
MSGRDEGPEMTQLREKREQGQGRRPVLRAIAHKLSFVLFVLVLTAKGQSTSESAREAGTPSATANQAAESAQHATDDGKVATPSANKSLSPEEERQAEIVADTAKLFQLAQELKAEVAKSNKNTLSIAVVKKSEEIQKLAKSLKERMRKD